jgi:hypothetical protein
MLEAVKRILATLVLATLALVLGLSVVGLAANEAREQTITPITPPVQQRVEMVTPPGEQRVEALDAEDMQGITHGSKGPVQRGAEAVGKVVIGVLAASIAIGATVAALLLM